MNVLTDSEYNRLFLRISGILLVVVGLFFLRATAGAGLLAYSAYSLTVSLVLITGPILAGFWVVYAARSRPPRHYLEEDLKR